MAKRGLLVTTQWVKCTRKLLQPTSAFREPPAGDFNRRPKEMLVLDAAYQGRAFSVGIPDVDVLVLVSPW